MGGPYPPSRLLGPTNPYRAPCNPTHRYMREKLAPHKRSDIIEYIACSMLTEEQDEAERTAITNTMKALCVQVHKSAHRSVQSQSLS